MWEIKDKHFLRLPGTDHQEGHGMEGKIYLQGGEGDFNQNYCSSYSHIYHEHFEAPKSIM